MPVSDLEYTAKKTINKHKKITILSSLKRIKTSDSTVRWPWFNNFLEMSIKILNFVFLFFWLIDFYWKQPLLWLTLFTYSIKLHLGTQIQTNNSIKWGFLQCTMISTISDTTTAITSTGTLVNTVNNKTGNFERNLQKKDIKVNHRLSHNKNFIFLFLSEVNKK